MKNVPNEQFKTKLKELKGSERHDEISYDRRIFFDNVDGVKNGEVVVCMKKSQVEELKEVFDNSNEWVIEKVEDTYIILPANANTYNKNQFQKIVTMVL